MEVTIYIGILGVVGGLFTGILLSITKTQVNEFSQNELSGQLNFSMQTIQQLVENSSLIDNDLGVPSSTLSLEMPAVSQDPTLIYIKDNQIFLQRGSSAPQAITNNHVSADSLRFNRISQPGAKDLVQIDIALSQMQPSSGQNITRTLSSSILRTHAATFDDNLNPNADNSYSIGTWPTLRWKDAAFSGSVRANNICFGSDCRNSWASTAGITGTGSAGYLVAWTGASTAGSSMIYDSGSGLGINVLSPQDLLHIKQKSIGQNIIGLEASASASRYDIGIDASGNLTIKNGSGNPFIMNSSGQVGVNTASLDTNYSFTVANGGIKVTNASANPAAYFSNTGDGYALQVTGMSTFSGNAITNVGTPIASTDVATKAYVDAASGGGLKVYKSDGTTLLGPLLPFTNATISACNGWGYVTPAGTFYFLTNSDCKPSTIPLGIIYYGGSNCTGSAYIGGGGNTWLSDGVNTFFFSSSPITVFLASYRQNGGSCTVYGSNVSGMYLGASPSLACGSVGNCIVK